MTDSKDPAGPQGDYYPPPPPGPPPGHNGLGMHSNEQQPIPESHSELYNSTPQTTGDHQQTTPHQPPPPDGDGAPKKTNWAQRFSSFGTKAAAPFNMLANKLGAESFLPSTMDKECDKAARILRNFCKDGIYTDAQAPETVEAPTTNADGKPTTAPAKPRKNRTLLTIPSAVINKAVGLAIFTTARAGFHVSGATGSGVIIARLPDGSWSPPSGIQVHSVGAGLMIGIDIYDCVVVINTREALEAFTKTRMSLGSDLAVVAGPWGAGGSVDFAAPQSGKGGSNNKTKDGVGEGSTETTKGTEDGATTGATSPPLGDDKVYDAPPVATAATTSTTCTAEPAPEPPRRLGEYTSWGGSSKKKQQQQPAGSTPARPDAGDRKPSALKQAIKQPTYSYVKSRGFYAGVQVDGTIVTERKDANAAFYGEPVAVQQILKGEVPLVPGKEKWAELVKPLFDTIKGAEGWHAQSAAGGGSSSGGDGGRWANQMGPDPNSTYGAAYDPVFDKKNENNDDNPPAKPPRPTSGGGGVTEGVANMNVNGGSFPPSSSSMAGAGAPPSTTGETTTPGARAKAAEAAAEAEMNREREERERRELAGVADPRSSMATAPPGYSAMAGGGEESSNSSSQQHTAAGATAAEDMPPAYVDEEGDNGAAASAAARSGAGDAKSPAGPGGQ